MTDDETIREPVNPLAEPLVTVAVGKAGKQRDVQGRPIAPGLAITPAQPNGPHRGGARYVLTHMPSGLALRVGLCGVHVQDMAKLAVNSGVDWTLGQDDVVAAVKETDLNLQLAKVGYCRDGYCAGDGTPPAAWGVSCSTCYWTWEDEYEEGPLDAREAKHQARDHRCDPEVTIQDPATGKWHDPFYVNDDGTVRDLTVSAATPPARTDG